MKSSGVELLFDNLMRCHFDISAPEGLQLNTNPRIGIAYYTHYAGGVCKTTQFDLHLFANLKSGRDKLHRVGCLSQEEFQSFHLSIREFGISPSATDSPIKQITLDEGERYNLALLLLCDVDENELCNDHALNFLFLLARTILPVARFLLRGHKGFVVQGCKPLERLLLRVGLYACYEPTPLCPCSTLSVGFWHAYGAASAHYCRSIWCRIVIVTHVAKICTKRCCFPSSQLLDCRQDTKRMQKYAFFRYQPKQV